MINLHHNIRQRNAFYRYINHFMALWRNHCNSRISQDICYVRRPGDFKRTHRNQTPDVLKKKPDDCVQQRSIDIIISLNKSCVINYH